MDQQHFRAQAELLESEADAARLRIAANVDALHERISPKRLMHDALGAVSAQGRKAYVRARGLLRRGGAGLAGGAAVLGLAKAMTNSLNERRSQDKSASTAYDEYEWLNEGEDAAEGKVDAARRARDLIAAQAEAARQRAEAEVLRAPLGVVAAAAAAGVLLGVLLPSREREPAHEPAYGGLSDYDETPSAALRKAETVQPEAAPAGAGHKAAKVADFAWDAAKIALTLAQPRVISLLFDLLKEPTAPKRRVAPAAPADAASGVSMMPEVGVRNTLHTHHPHMREKHPAHELNDASEVAHKAGQL